MQGLAKAVMGSRLLDTSDELIVLPYGAGVTLVSEKQFKKNQLDKLAPSDRKIYSVSELFKLLINVYFLNLQSVMQNINKTTIETCGYASVKTTIGKTVTNKKRLRKSMITIKRF